MSQLTVAILAAPAALLILTCALSAVVWCAASALHAARVLLACRSAKRDIAAITVWASDARSATAGLISPAVVVLERSARMLAQAEAQPAWSAAAARLSAAIRDADPDAPGIIRAREMSDLERAQARMEEICRDVHPASDLEKARAMARYIALDEGRSAAHEAAHVLGIFGFMQAAKLSDSDTTAVTVPN